MSQDGTVILVTKLQAVWFEVREGQEIYQLSKISIPALGPLSLHGYCGVFSRDKMAGGIWLSQHLHLVVRLQMSGAILHPLYAFITCTGTTLRSHYVY